MNPTLEDILSHDRWLRRTALALTRDPGAAEDLVQDAWVAGLEKDRANEEDRPWFKGLLRHRLAGNRRSAANARVKARRSAEGRPRLGAAADDVAQARELRQSVARELMDLKEPLRQAVYLRFIAGQSNVEVARETGVAESTASQRISRGLEELRTRLDETVQGGRAAWAPALMRIAVPPEAVPSAGIGAAGIAAAAALLAAGTAAVLWEGPPDAGLQGIDARGAVLSPEDPQGGPTIETGGTQVELKSGGTRSPIPHSVRPSRRQRGPSEAPPPIVVPAAPKAKERPQTANPGQGPPRPSTAGAITVQVVEPLLFRSFGKPLDETRVLLVNTGSPRAVRSPTSAEQEPSLHDTFDVLFDAPPAGIHRVEISDPRFDPYISKQVSGGEQAKVRLVGSASLTLHVQGPGGLYPTDMEVTLTYKDIQSSVSSFAANVEGGLIDDVVPWSYTLNVRAAEGTAQVDVDDLAPNEHRVVEAHLVARAEVKGWLQYPDGSPASGELVRLVRYRGAHRRGAQIEEIGELWFNSPHRVSVEETEAGPRGEFLLHAEDGGNYVVVAGRAGEPQVESPPLELSTSEVAEAIELTLSRGGLVHGRIVADAGRGLRGSQVLTFDQERKSTRPTFPQPKAVRADGSFELGPLPPGKVSIYWYPAGHTNFGADMSGRPAGGQFLGEVHVVEKETIRPTLSLPQ